MNKNKKIAVGVGIVVLIIILARVFFSGGATQSGINIKIGLMSPLSDQYAVAGQNFEKGVEVAKGVYEKNHPGTHVSLVVEDDGFNVGKGTSAFKKFTSIDNVDAIIMLSTPVIDAIYPQVVAWGKPTMQMGIQTAGVAQDNIFQTSPSADKPILDYAAYINTHYSFKKVAVLYDNTSGGLSFFEAFKKGYKGVYDPFILSGKNDARDSATKVVYGGYDAVVFLTSPENGALAVKQILSLTKKPPLFAFDAQLQTGFSDYARILGDTKILNGSLSVWIKAGDQKKFIAEYKEKYNAEPGFVADFGYDSFNILMNAYDKDLVVWKQNIQNTKGDGAAGGIEFDENGVRLQAIAVNKVIDGKIVPIDGI